MRPKGVDTMGCVGILCLGGGLFCLLTGNWMGVIAFAAVGMFFGFMAAIEENKGW